RHSSPTSFPTRRSSDLQAEITAAHSATGPSARYSLRKGHGFWTLTFDGQQTVLKHEKGILYVSWLLHNPPEHPIHAVDLMAKIPDRKSTRLNSSHVSIS